MEAYILNTEKAYEEENLIVRNNILNTDKDNQINCISYLMRHRWFRLKIDRYLCRKNTWLTVLGATM